MGNLTMVEKLALHLPGDIELNRNYEATKLRKACVLFNGKMAFSHHKEFVIRYLAL